MAKQKTPDIERRKTPRKDVLETFSVFLVLPRKGLRKLYLKDVSEGGMAFYAEPGDEFVDGETIPGFFYINPSLKLPISLRIVHTVKIDGEDGARLKVGCEFSETNSKGFRAFLAFVNLLDQLSAFVDAY